MKNNGAPASKCRVMLFVFILLLFCSAASREEAESRVGRPIDLVRVAGLDLLTFECLRRGLKDY